jgi:hypothetical protein
METLEIEKIALAVFNDYREYIEARLRKQLKRQFSSSDLERSLEVLVSNKDFHIAASVAFADYGRILDMKRRYQNPPAPLKAIEEWLIKKGIGTDNVSGYKPNSGRRSSLSEGDKIKRIARAITTSQKSQVRRRAWYAGNMYRSAFFLIKQLAAELSKNAMKEVVNELAHGS